MPTITESLTVIYERDCCTELYLLEDGTIQLHAEDTEGAAAEPIYSVEQARALHEALGHLLYLANQEA